MAEVAENLPEHDIDERENLNGGNEEIPLDNGHDEQEAEEVEIDEAEFFFHERENFVPPPNTALFYLHVAPSCVMIFIIWWSFRTHNQFYPTILHLTTSKMAFCAFGTSVATLCLQFFRWVSHVFLGALRLAERETIAEGMRWGLTETCLALTMFRDEMNFKVGGMFVLLVGAKGWHWAVEMRGKHLGNTQEVFYLNGDSKIPRVRWNHFKFIVFTYILLILDALAVFHCGSVCAKEGPSVHILFGFEAAVLSITASTTIGLYLLHVWDGFLNISIQLQEMNKEPLAGEENENHDEDDEEEAQNQQNKQSTVSTWETYSHNWKEKRGIYTLALGLLSQAATFLSYFLFFAIVFMYYGMPINIFRELYVSYQKLRLKITAFVSYWNLSRDLDNKFETVLFNTEKENEPNSDDEDQEENDEEEATCIICRDQMSTGKKLPGCGHVFHAYCLKGWLMQQQSCPTCRSDITAAAARCKKIDNESQENDPATEDEVVEEDQEEEDYNEKESAVSEANDAAQNEENKMKSRSDGISPSKNETKTNKSSDSAFPCLYRVENSNGAPVYSMPLASVAASTTISFNPDKSIRTVPQNKLIICTDMKYMNGKMMLEMPDGWVIEQDVKRIVALPFSIPDSFLNSKKIS